MFSAPRFIAIDDKPHHLTGLLDTFQKLGTPCLGIHFTGDTPEADHFRHARVIFMDLHLLDTGAGTSDTQHYNLIAGILLDCMRPQCGPFVLVLWTEHPEKCAALQQLLDERLADDPHCRPLAIIPLGKGKFIHLTDGKPNDAAGLLTAVRETVSRNPQLSALLAWEARAMDAASATLGALLDLVPADKRSAATCGPEIDRLLSILAIAAVGQANVKCDRQGAVMQALAPILADRMAHVETRANEDRLWKAAVTRVPEKPGVSPEDAGRVNRMLHIAVPIAEKIRPIDRGAVVDVPADWLTEEGFKREFGVTEETARREFGVAPTGTVKGLRWVLLQIQAACDHAQTKPGLQPYVLALEIPFDPPWVKGERDALWASPLLLGEAGLFRLVANSRFRLGLPKEEANPLRVRYRLREQLLGEAVHHVQSHGNRPGIVYLEPPKRPEASEQTAVAPGLDVPSEVTGTGSQEAPKLATSAG